MTRGTILSAIAAVVAALLVSPAVHAMDQKKVKKDDPKQLEDVRAHIAKAEWQPAQRLLEPLTKSHANSANVFNLLGFVQRKTGQFDESLKNYRRALKLDPKHLEAHVYLGELYIQTKKLEKAAALGKRIAKLCPKGCKPRAELEAALAKVKW